MSNLDEKLKNLAQLIIKSKNIVALTGAGMSTESKIPDFRSPGTGLWENVDPYEFASIDTFLSNSENNMKYMLELGLQIFRARPNKGHKALTILQKLGKLIGVLTQNIDRLHHKAHTKNVVEFHGNAYEAQKKFR